MLKGKKIVLGITGSIAAYKAAFLTRLLIKAGAEVQVLMTQSATTFISPLTLSTLSKRPVFTDVHNGESWNNHVELGLWADVMLVAPLTATTLGKMANGISDNIIVATYLSARCAVFVAPAMDLDMWAHPSTKGNIDKLISYGNHIIPVGHGELASGLVGAGRMGEPEDIVKHIGTFLNNGATPTSSTQELPLKGKKAIVTAGPTYEPIDPVRFIGNRSSGKMGVAIAEALALQGAEVQLILGPSNLSTEATNVQLIRVQTAQDMYDAATKNFGQSDIAVMAAAVADYRPKTVADKKLKKGDFDLTIPLERTQDIAAALGKVKKKHQVIIGFALETNNELENAKGKLKKKNFDMIVLNSLQDKGAGFKHDTNKVTFITEKQVKAFPLKTKVAVAQDIANHVIQITNPK